MEVMRAAVGYKFRADEGLRALLISTDPHPLASVKSDCFWGIGFEGEGKNMLAKLLDESAGRAAARGPWLPLAAARPEREIQPGVAKRRSLLTMINVNAESSSNV